MLDDNALDIIFRNARSQNKWQDKPVTDEQLQQIYELTKWGPTCANSCPMRIVFCKSVKAKEQLVSVTLDVNKNKVRQAPVSAILAYDFEFHKLLPKLMPVKPEFEAMYANNLPLAEATAFRNGSLQAAYFMIAVRSLGLDCGPMSGFDNEACDKLFFPDGRIKSNFICSIGYGDSAGVFPRQPRLDFDEACQIQ